MGEAEKKVEELESTYAENEETLRGYYQTNTNQGRITEALATGTRSRIEKVTEDYGTNYKKMTEITAEEEMKQVQIADENARLMEERCREGVFGATEEMRAGAEKQLKNKLTRTKTWGISSRKSTRAPWRAIWAP